MRTLCQTIDPTTDAVTRYAALLERLRGAFDVGVYNLNYDTVALTAWWTESFPFWIGIVSEVAAYLKQHQMNPRLAFVGKLPAMGRFGVLVGKNREVSAEVFSSQLSWPHTAVMRKMS